MDDFALLIDLHRDHDRLGPGSDEETRRALALARLDAAGPLAVADVGCGTGAAALVLARDLDARVTAIDFAPAFVERVRARAAAAGLAGRISAEVGDMATLPFADGSLDLLWSEGAIYNLGFTAGVRAWRRLLRPGGVLAVTEITWTTAARPADVEAYWTGEYPEMTTASGKLAILEEAGYRPLAHFFLPASCWEAQYFAPLRAGFEDFLDRHDRSDAARATVEAMEAEMRLFAERGAWFGYAFYVAQRPADDADGDDPSA